MRNGFDIEKVRADFPILSHPVRGHRLVFLDSGASAQKPRQVLDKEREVYETGYANVHRGLHYLSEEATANYEGARVKIAGFINARHSHEVLYTKGTTEGINLVASSYGRKFLTEGDEVIITHMEHHSNIVPWQMLRDEVGIVLKVIPVDDDGSFHLDQFRELITERTKIVSVTHVSNVLGTVVPIKQVCQIARDAGAISLIDGAQGIVHLPIDVQDIGCDFYAFSGHKLYGPSGIGVLYGREELLNEMPPYQGGGDMIETVTFEKTTWADLPHKFEAGTPPITQAIALGAAIDYVRDIGIEAIGDHEAGVLNYATQQLASVEGLRLIGTAAGKASVISFAMDCAHPHDISTIIDQQGVAIRAGHHCAQPLMDRFDLPSTARVTLGMYNDRDDIDALVQSLEKVREIFA
ncbi:MAG: cysteine desulfurase [Rhodospirillaceae bacterium]|jgi:cysteine desulfurase / selenocysteine lyase|nr:cysteine desulfurase [Rhodospirillaceae bacterium]MBT6136205.1 cysteine desulfurase [Rhodospirillaceae bacterium]